MRWNPVYFEYGEYNSKKYPSDGWFSGKREGKLVLETFTDAIGFGFPVNDSNDPIYLPIDMQESFKIKYILSKTLLIGAVFERKGDVNLTELKMFFLPETDVERTHRLPLNEFAWKEHKKIKHLKFNYLLLTGYDEVFVKALLFFKLDKVVKCYYFRAI